MSFGQRCFSATEGLFDRLLCVAGAVAFSQIPTFMQQYLQRLGGHLDEARRQLAQFENVAKQSGLTLDRLIAQTNANSDAAVAKLGGVMSENVTRVADLQQAHDALLNASILEKPWVFIRNLDSEIASGTWHVFQPAVPTTLEGLIYALLGMLFFITLYHGGVKTGGRALQRRWKKRITLPDSAATPVP
ncbi:DUF2937 family protein [Oleiharenicola lentus]|uniref:DUF2937 family protein n=1 Tax=Oleiharenicola lentus TaxID=2508720 RepID=UPI003F66B3BB